MSCSICSIWSYGGAVVSSPGMLMSLGSEAGSHRGALGSIGLNSGAIVEESKGMREGRSETRPRSDASRRVLRLDGGCELSHRRVIGVLSITVQVRTPITRVLCQQFHPQRVGARHHQLGIHWSPSPYRCFLPALFPPWFCLILIAHHASCRRYAFSFLSKDLFDPYMCSWYPEVPR